MLTGRLFFLFPQGFGLRRMMALASVPALFLVSSASQAQSDKDSGGGSSLGDLLNKVKDLKVPESVSNLPTQLTELKESYLETTQTVDELRAAVAALREEVEALKADNALLREAVGSKVASNARSDLLKPIEVSSTELVKAWRDDRESAAATYGGRYIRAVGIVDAFETGVQEVIVVLKAEGDARVRCHIRRDANFHAEVQNGQGRMIDRNDRSTLLTVGQPVAILGTCDGIDLDVKLSNCKIEGLEVKRVDPPAAKN